MVAVELDLLIEQGATFDRLFTIKNKSTGDPRDLTGYTAKMQIRLRYNSQNFLVELTTENDRIELGGEEGTVRLLLDAETTAEIQVCDEAVYDLELWNDDVVEKLLRGHVTVIQEVTR